MKMTLFIIGLVVLTAAVIAVLTLRRSSNVDRAANNKSQAKTLEEKLANLKTCGLQLAPAFTVDSLLKSWDRAEYEKDGYDLVLVGLGMNEEQEPWRNHSVNVWHFDTEAIEDHGDYKRIAERMVEMTQGSLALENIQDHVDVEKGEAWLSFTYKRKSIRIDCEVQDDWVDTAIFGRFVDLLKQSDPSKLYVYYDLGGQDCIIGCVTKVDFECLKSRGLKFVPLT